MKESEKKVPGLGMNEEKSSTFLLSPQLRRGRSLTNIVTLKHSDHHPTGKGLEVSEVHERMGSRLFLQQFSILTG